MRVQGVGGVLVEAVVGSVSGVVGLPLAESLALLAEVGFPMPWSDARERRRIGWRRCGRRCGAGVTLVAVSKTQPRLRDPRGLRGRAA